jgi:hypothetical protein
MTDEPRSASQRHWQAVDAGYQQSRVRSSSAALREYANDRALLDVLCRRRLILRVVDSEPLNAVTEEVSGRVFNIVDITVAPVILVDCRCGQSHEIDTAALTHLAPRARPGRPRVVDVRTVLAK